MTEKPIIEPQAYGPDCSAAVKEFLIARVTPFRHDIVLLKEIPVQSEFSIDLMFDQVEKIAESMGPFYALVDLTEAQRPPARMREYLRKRLGRLTSLKYVALFTGKNFVLNMAAQFVFGTTTFSSFSVHKTQEEALLAIEKAQSAEKESSRIR